MNHAASIAFMKGAGRGISRDRLPSSPRRRTPSPTRGTRCYSEYRCQKQRVWAFVVVVLVFIAGAVFFVAEGVADS